MPIVKFVIKWGLILAVIASIAIGIAIAYYCQGLLDIENLDRKSDKQIVQINFSNNERITNFGDIYYDEVQFYELPQHLINAVVATEDRKFFNHIGIDVFAIIRAYQANHKAGKIVQGGSTITQQLAKLLFLNPERTIQRKIQEVILALQLERRFTKEQIITIYLNRAYFGSGNYGVAAAAKFYFGKPVSDIDLNEAAMIAGLLKAPSKLSPKNNQNSAENRANVVIRGMIKSGFLSEKNIKEINKDISFKTNSSQKLYFADFVHDQFADFLAKKDLDKKLFLITTTLDEKVQVCMEEATNDFVVDNAKKIDKSQIAVIIMNKDGAVLGMSGGKDYQKSQYNRAVSAKRQPGSVFKTFIYLAAFEKGFKPSDVFEDKKVNIGAWLPDNYEGKYFGKVDLKTAFAKSLNSVSIQLAQKINQRDITDTATKLGIVSQIDKNDLTIALGTTEVTLYELTAAFASIANNAKPVIPYAISSIKDDKNREIYKRESSGLPPVLSEETKEYAREILRAVVEDGTGSKANISPNIFGKTGTSQNFRDAWFVGFDNDYVIGVWIGNDDNSSTKKITGGSLPAELFAKILKKL
ncbi:MAG: PBP1A family penicillin-binding protein [Rickettsiales bacterium]|nr:PBP1A family penicillin-binding protein [Rickettsiales bacterium]